MVRLSIATVGTLEREGRRRLRKKPVVGILTLILALASASLCLFGSIDTTLSPSLLLLTDNPALRHLSPTFPSDAAATIQHVERLFSWENEFDVVHILQTRFMQMQPDLVHLGRARLAMFRTICLRSLQRQTSQQFLWLIRTDPELNPELRESLVALVKDVPNIILLASNKYPDGFRYLSLEEDITSIWSGSAELLQSYHAASQTRVVLESRLDADDGLASNYMETIQRRAAATMLVQRQQQTTVVAATASAKAKAWRVWCVDSLIEWQYFSTWQRDDKSSLSSSNTTNTLDDGALWIDHSKDLCVSTGLTWGYQAESRPSDRIVAVHHKILSHIPSCEQQQHQQGFNDSNTNNCVERVQPSGPAAIRARTPTSAGMKDVSMTPPQKKLPNNEKLQQQWKGMQDALWRDVSILFGIQGNEIHAMRATLEQHLPEIVADALSGQCIKGGVPGTCKKQSSTQLRSLLNVLSKEES